MAYRDLTTRPDVEFLGGTQTRPVLVLSAWTLPHEVYFEARYPSKGFTVKDAKDTALGFSIVIEDLFAIPGVEDVQWLQIETPAHELQDAVTLYVSSTSGNSSDTLTIPYSKLSQNVSGAGIVAVDVQVERLRGKLDALEGG